MGQNNGVNPIPWEKLEPNFEDRERWLDCPHYEDCLNKAAKEDWRGWTCWFCDFQKERRNNDNS